MMNTRIKAVMFIAILTIGFLLIAACSSSAPTAEPASDDSAQTMEESDEHMEEEQHENGDEHEEGDAHEEGDVHVEDEHEEGDDHGGDHVHADVPHEFEDLENPFAGDAAAVAAGEELFELYCVSCHGETGMGDGPAAAGLDPKPATLADAEMMSDMSDAYIFWRVTEGGAMEPFNSAMPPWGEILTEEQRWQLVGYVRSLTE